MSYETLSQYEFPATLLDLDGVKTPEGAVYASSGEEYRWMFFGRDSLESADDLLNVRPKIAKSVLLKLASLQGTETRDISAEEPGRVSHQHMQLYENGERLPSEAENKMHFLSERWGGDENGFTYYGSLDATPLFARLAARYALIHGTDILSERLTDKNGESITLLDSMKRSLDWMSRHIESSELGLLEFRRLSDKHIVVQSWRDSGSAFLHMDGQRANIDEFIAPLEVQGYAYDAFKLAEMLDDVAGITGEDKQKWSYYADILQENTLGRFWMPEVGQFAMGIDRDENHQPRQIKTWSSSQGVLMDSRILIDLPENDRKTYLEGIIGALYGPEFLTEVGVRCRAARFSDLAGFADYHGSWAVWAKESYDFAKGLRRQGLDNLADDIERRILNMANISGAHYEFLYVNPAGEVDYFPKRYNPEDPHGEVIVGSNVPDKGQAWTISAVLAIKRGERPLYRAIKTTWAEELEDRVLGTVVRAKLLSRGDELRAKRSKSKQFSIDTAAGIVADMKWNPDWWK